MSCSNLCILMPGSCILSSISVDMSDVSVTLTIIGPFKNDARTVCFNVTALSDSEFEGNQTFLYFLTVSGDDPRVMVSPNTTVVTIMDYTSKMRAGRIVLWEGRVEEECGVNDMKYSIFPTYVTFELYENAFLVTTATKSVRHIPLPHPPPFGEPRPFSLI